MVTFIEGFCGLNCIMPGLAIFSGHFDFFFIHLKINSLAEVFVYLSNQCHVEILFTAEFLCTLLHLYVLFFTDLHSSCS